MNYIKEGLKLIQLSLSILNIGFYIFEIFEMISMGPQYFNSLIDVGT